MCEKIKIKMDVMCDKSKKKITFQLKYCAISYVKITLDKNEYLIMRIKP